MKKFFVLLFGLVVVILMVGCLNLEGIFPFLNQAPVVISEPIITATEDQLYSYQVEASDPNGDTLTYSFTAKLEGMNIDSESGLITWTPTNAQVGIHQVEVEISDGKQSATQSFEIEVINVNNPPQILSYSPTNKNIKINEGSSVKFEIQARDIDLNTVLSYQWLLNGKKVSSSTVSGDGSKSGWVYSASYGDYSQKIVKVLITDGELQDQDYVQWNITINDITPPTQPTLNTVTSPTNIPTQTLSGNKESNTSIWINGVEVISANSDTTWSYSYNLSEGTNNISVTSRDAAGNESSAVSITIALDISAPEIPTLDEVISPTNISPQILSGTKEANTSIWINGTEAVPLDSSNKWSYPFTLIEGENNISITSCDAVGNESAAVNDSITLDTISPTIPTLHDIISPTNICTQLLSGNKEINSSIWVNGVEVISVNSETTWSYDFELTEGENSISIISKDTVGNESNEINTTIILDISTPTIPGLDTITSPTNISIQTLSGTKEINTSVWINGTEVVTLNLLTDWSYSYNLSEGTNNISITSRDVVGNESTAVTEIIVLDTINPVAPTLDDIVSPTNISLQTLSGTKEANTSIWLNGVEVVPLDSSVNWLHTYNLSEGTNNISVTSRDAAGNESSVVTATIEYDSNVYVDKGNITGIEDGTETHPFDTITEGIEAVTSGKSVMVAEGTYNEQLIINKSITLQGAGKESTSITIPVEYIGNLITITADDVTISGFNIDGNSNADIGIYSDSSSSIEISENIIQNHQDSGILYHRTSGDYPSGIYVYNNEICHNSKNGIKVIGAGSGVIEGNIIRNSYYGIKASDDTSIEVKMNNIYNNSDSGIFCRNNSSSLIWSNEITSNGCGIRVGEQYNDTATPDIGGGTRGGIGKNNIFGNSINLYGVINMTDHNIFAKYNWWGDIAGPKYPNNPDGNTNLSSDWVYWDDINNKAGAIIFEDYLTEPQTF